MLLRVLQSLFPFLQSWFPFWSADCTALKGDSFGSISPLTEWSLRSVLALLRPFIVLTFRRDVQSTINPSKNRRNFEYLQLFIFLFLALTTHFFLIRFFKITFFWLFNFYISKILHYLSLRVLIPTYMLIFKSFQSYLLISSSFSCISFIHIE